MNDKPAVCELLQTLFTSKGLYQNERLPETLANRALALETHDPPAGANYELIGTKPPSNPPLRVRYPVFQTDCTSCRTQTSFGPNCGRDGDTGDGSQWFTVEYECTGCGNLKLVFMFTKTGNKLQLTGRSRPYRPKVASEFDPNIAAIVKDAVAAKSENDVAAAYYHLRTAIEHDMKLRLKIDVKKRLTGEELSEQYGESLDETFKERFPQYGGIYSELSDGAHTRNVSPDRFDKLLKKVTDHVHGRTMLDEFPHPISPALEKPQ